MLSKNKLINFLITLFIFFLLFPQISSAWSGKVVGVSDGDTIKVIHNGTQEKIRLYGIDCPEKGQPFGQKAREFTAGIVAGKTVEVKPSAIDKYGRTVAWIYADGKCVNKELLKAGMAWHYKKYSTESNLADLEAHAKMRRIGLWGDPDQTAPWEFRHRPEPKKLIAEAGIIYHGNTNSYKFHRPGCRHYGCRNCTAIFKSREEAISAGYSPCKICKP